MNYKMTVQYDGSRYAGWQKQGNTEQTIQARLEKAISTLLAEPVSIQGSGRTDAGVHALGQVASFHTEQVIRDCRKFLLDLNAALPSDIAVTRLDAASPRFHARLNAKEKTYRYSVWNSPIPNVLQRKLQYQLPDPLDDEAMRTAASMLLGTHDFAGFSTGHTKKSTVRHIRSIQIIRNDELVEFYFTGNGFLHNMVRILTGTLIEVGLHRRSPESVLEILESKDRTLAGFTAPAQGLCLMEVNY